MATKRKTSPAPVRSTPARKKKEVAKAENFISETLAAGAAALAETKAKRKRKKDPWGHVTAEQIINARDELRLSWRDVGVKLEIGSPSTARAAYTALTGKPHTESQAVVKRAPKGVGGITGKNRVAVISRPEWDQNTPDEVVTEAIRGRVIIVRRSAGVDEEIRVTTGTERAGPKGTWKSVNVLQRGIRVRNLKGKLQPAQFTFTQAETGHARTVCVSEIVSIR
jgi:hypothetical protein